MEYRQLGKSGLRVSAVGLGTNQFGGKVDADGVRRLIDEALAAGVNFIDTADTYTGGRSEETIGKAIRGRRDKVIIATKVGSRVGDGPNDAGASRQRIMNGVEASLRRLGTDYIDLYQIHRVDPHTPFEETMRALDDLVRAGKVRYIGASNYAAWQLCRSNDLAEMHGWTPFVSIQPHYHMLERSIEKELVPYCQAFGIGIIPYFPLAGGFLTGKYKRGEKPPEGSRGESSSYVQRYFTPRNFSLVEKLSGVAQAHGRTMAELAIAWLLTRPQVSTVICGVTSPEQLAVNVRAADWQLAPETLEEIERMLADGASGD
ncbi:MAG: aldo/keto reductase [Firmicutes bacterium]|jgi:aryl-alcohol dehydrogenase-like predicted oxidoreductase|nr:aldo/keto reductase [Bacillota bacterium]